MVAAAAWVLLQGAAIFWSAVLPIILALIVCTILWPVTARLRSWKFPPALAVLTTILGFFLILGGILGALVATHSDAVRDDPHELARLAATASVIHGLAAERASGGGPLTILGLCSALPATVAELLSRR